MISSITIRYIPSRSISETELAKLVKQDKITKLRALLQSGFNTNTQVDNVPLLSFAIEKKNEKAVNLLLKNPKTNIDLPNWGNFRPIRYAMFSTDAIAQKIIKKTSVERINARDPNGYTPLLLASFHGHVNKIRYLLNKVGIDVNAQNPIKQTALELIATHKKIPLSKKISLIEQLVFLGADFSYLEKRGAEEVFADLLKVAKSKKKERLGHIQKLALAHLSAALTKEITSWL